MQARVIERKKKSWTWEYFTPDNTKEKSEKNSHAICHFCKESIPMKDFSTNYLSNHLRLDHGVFKPGKEANRSKANTIDVCNKEQQDKIDKNLYVLR